VEGDGGVNGGFSFAPSAFAAAHNAYQSFGTRGQGNGSIIAFDELPTFGPDRAFIEK
jgi:hypothetical protein